MNIWESQLPELSATLGTTNPLTAVTWMGEHGISLFEFAFLRYLVRLTIFHMLLAFRGICNNLPAHVFCLGIVHHLYWFARALYIAKTWTLYSRDGESISPVCHLLLNFIFGRFFFPLVCYFAPLRFIWQPAREPLLPPPNQHLPRQVPSAWGPFKFVAWSSPFDLLSPT